MTYNQGNPEPVQFQGPRQERIHRRLGLIGEGPQAFYRDALRLLAGGPVVESTSHLVGHLLREIESALRDVLEPIAHYEALKSKGKTSDVHEREIRIIVKELGLSESEGAGAAWLEIASGGLHTIAHRRSLERPRPFDEHFHELWIEVETILDGVLERFESRYLDLHDEADRLLAKDVPSEADLKYLKDYLPNNIVTRHYFFSNLRHAGWLQPLAKAGFFSDPPSAIRDEQAGTISFTPWPVTQYLDRMADVPEEQELVLQILLDIPDTDNIRVFEALTATVLTLPESFAVRLVDRIAGWMSSRSVLSLLREKVGEVAAKLVAGGYKSEGFFLLSRVLDMGFIRDSRGTRHSHEAYEYGQVLELYLPEFRARWPFETMELACGLLEDGLRSEDPNSATRLDSYLWRRSIESPRPYRRHEILDMLVDAVRDVAIAIVAADEVQVFSVVESLERRASAIFGRIALHVLGTFPHAAPKAVEDRLRTRDLFDRWTQEPEYVRLLTVAFGELSEDAQKEILGWISEGPDLNHYEVRTPEDAVAIRANWERSRLKPLKGKLSDYWEERLHAFEQDLSQGDDFDLEDDAWVGLTSPRSADELKHLPVEDVVGFLKDWQPKPGLRESSREGLGSVLASVVAESPVAFAEQALLFRGLGPTYVRAGIQGFEQALKSSRSFSWPALLDLCDWVVNQRLDGGTERSDLDQDQGWGWSRKAVASLLAAGVDCETNPIPFDARAKVWAILEPITWDSDPSPERDTGSPENRAFHLTINSVRGEAVLAEIRYAVWVTKNLRKTGDDHCGMDAIPEVQRNLSQHLDVALDPSPATRAALGYAFPVLHWVDPDWTARNVSRIFPEDREQAALRNAAWSTYLIFQRPYKDPFAVLVPVYERAVEELDRNDAAIVDHESAEHHLADHLMAHYWHGVPGADSLARRFFDKAGKALRRRALEFIGRSLSNGEEEIPAEVLARLRDLWEWRFARAKATDGASELQEFGWWLASGKFDSRWAIEQALLVLREGSSLEPDHMVLEYLVTLAHTQPLAAAKILEGELDNLRDHWSLHGWRQEAREILTAALSSTDRQAVQVARAVVNKLAARGRLEFRDLLNSSEAQGGEENPT